jgi:hypothetical protein
MSEQTNLAPKPLPPKIVAIGAIMIAVGLIFGVALYATQPERAMFSYLLGFQFALSVALGGLFLVALEYVTNAVWSAPIRRAPEFLAVAIPFLLVAALPLVFNLDLLFEWAVPEIVKEDPLVAKKTPYLNETFFTIRVFLYFAIWTLFLFAIVGNSWQQDVTTDQRHTRRNVVFSAIFLPLFAITITFNSFDWIMSLAPHWISTIFGVYYFSGAAVAALAAVTWIVVELQENGYITLPNPKAQYYSLGSLLFGFINFWAYIAFSQYLLIWYANIPETTFWFIYRWKDGWMILSIVLIFAHFLIPYSLLVSRPAKDNPKRLKFVAVWMLVAHFLDLYWQIMPQLHAESTSVSSIMLELAFPIAFIGGMATLFHTLTKKRKIIPEGDPKLKRGLHYRV